MPEVEIIFSPEQIATVLLELLSDLCKMVQSSADDQRRALSLARSSQVIKGGPEDDAVLCTSDKRYNIRSVMLLNPVLLVSPSPELSGHSKYPQ
jgi:sister chromatid cohesion protein DCC1